MEVCYSKYCLIFQWLSLVIVGLIFFCTYFAVQIRCSINKSSGEVSSDGIAGARLCGIFISSILLPFILGIYIYQAINIIMILAGVLLLLICRKNISSFFLKINGKKFSGWYIWDVCFYYVGFSQYLHVWTLHHVLGWREFQG